MSGLIASGGLVTYLPRIDGDASIRDESEDADCNHIVDPIVLLRPGLEGQANKGCVVCLTSTGFKDLDIGAIGGGQGLPHIRGNGAIAVD